MNIGAKKRRRKPKVEPLSKAEYASYMRSPEWQATRKRYWASKFPKKCKACGVSGVPLDLHHKSYKTLGSEHLHHLILLCRSCHNEVHDFHKKSGRNLWSASNKVVRKKARKIRKERIAVERLANKARSKKNIKGPSMAPKRADCREKQTAANQTMLTNDVSPISLHSPSNSCPAVEVGR